MVFSDDAPWPEPGANVFDVDPDWWTNAQIAHDPNRWILYVQGYRLAGDLLVESLERHRDNDFVIYPLIFLYRHHLEIAMKMVIRLGTRLLDGTESSPERTHGLKKTWRQVRVLLRRYSRETRAPLNTNDLSAVEAYLDQIVRVDPKSETSRFPEKAMPKDLELVGLRRLQRSVAAVSNFLDACIMQFSVDLDNQMDYEAEMRRQYGDDACE